MTLQRRSLSGTALTQHVDSTPEPVAQPINGHDQRDGGGREAEGLQQEHHGHVTALGRGGARQSDQKMGGNVDNWKKTSSRSSADWTDV